MKKLFKSKKFISLIAAVAAVAAAAIILFTPHEVTINTRGCDAPDDVVFPVTTMGRSITLFKSLTASLNDIGSKKGTIAPPDIDGWAFTGCTDADGNLVDIQKRVPITHCTTLYYDYKQSLTPVKFVEDGKVARVVNETKDQPCDPSQMQPAFAESHPYEDFDGWDEQVITTSSESEKVYQAKWKGKTYAITYDLNGGYADGNPDSYQYGSGVESFQDASKSGSTFDGWFDDAGNKVESIGKDGHDDVHLTAHFTAIPAAQPSASSSYSRGSSNASNYGGGSYVSQASGGGDHVSFNTGYSANLSWDESQATVDLPDTASIFNGTVYHFGDYIPVEGEEDRPIPENVDFQYYVIQDHNGQGGWQVDSASVMYVTMGGQNYTLHKLDTIYDDSNGHYGQIDKYAEHAEALGAHFIFSTCTDTGVEYVFWN